MKATLPKRKGNDSWKRARAIVDLVSGLQHTLSNWKDPEVVSKFREATGIGSDLNPLGNIEEQAVLLLRNLLAGTVIDFDDMLWLGSSQGLKLDYTGQGYNWILVDEVQDLSPDMIEVVSKCIKQDFNSRVIIVGNHYQSIYQWRGAEDAFNLFRSKLLDSGTITEFYLPYCRRCPLAHLELASQFYGPPEAQPKFSLLPFRRDQGTVARINFTELSLVARQFKLGDAVIAERNHPIVKYAYGTFLLGIPTAIVSVASLKTKLQNFFREPDIATLRTTITQERQMHRNQALANGEIPSKDEFFDCVASLIEEIQDVPTILSVSISTLILLANITY